MTPWPPRPRKWRFMKEMYRISNRFVRVARIVEYGPAVRWGGWEGAGE